MWNTMMTEALVTKVKKKYELVKTSWNYHTKDYFENSSLHGVRYIAEEDRPSYEKLLWLFLVMMSGLTTLVIIYTLWDRFQTNPTITGLDVEFQNFNVTFPGISFCPSIPTDRKRVEAYVYKTFGKNLDPDKFEYYFDFVTNLANLSWSTLPVMAKYKGDTSLPQILLRDLTLQVARRCEELFKDCNYKGEEYKCCEGFLPSFTEIGLCYSFNCIHSETVFMGKDPNFIPEMKVRYIEETDKRWSIIIDTFDLGSNTLKIYIHSPDILPGPDMPPQHIWIRRVNNIYFAARMTYTSELARQLSPKQRQCVFEDEVTFPISDKYSYWACRAHCRMVTAKRKCRCVPHFYKNIEGYPYCNIDGLACLARYANLIKTKLHCGCELGCVNEVYEVEKLTDVTFPDQPEPLEIGFVFWPTERYRREVIFGLVDLLVSFGGIAGLFLGFSLLSVVEIVYFFTLRSFCMVRREEGKLVKIKNEERKKPNRIPYLSMTPTFMRKKRKRRIQEDFSANKREYRDSPFVN